MRPARCAALLLLVTIAGGCASRRDSGPSEPLREPEWYATNLPLMTAYLQTLPDSAIGRPLDGILISDGRRWFEGVTYLGKPEGLPKGIEVRLLDDGVQPRAYMWVAPGGEPYPLESCTEPPFKGIRAVRLGGGPYAWKSLRPEHGVVFTPCPPPAWLPEDRPSNRPSPDEGHDG
jgi:hypothetical protein